MPPFVPGYLIGLVTAPLVGLVLKPLLRGAVKTTVGATLQVKKFAAEAAEDIQDLAAEASAEFVATGQQAASGVSGVTPKKRGDG